MGSTPSPSRRPRHFWVILIGLALLLLVTRGPSPKAAPATHDHMVMSEQAMQEKIKAWFATHPESKSDHPLADPVDTFFVDNFYFDDNHDQINGPDTAFIQPGDAVMWQWVGGGYTTTSGTDPNNPDAGLLWDASLTSVNPTFVHVFPDEGTFHFFCIPHYPTMQGAVVVQQAVAVRPTGDLVSRIGFLSAPTPNPTSGRVLFRFGLRQAGLARAEILDARGRLIAVPVNDHLQAGAFSGVWNGLTTSGGHVSPGVYYLRLTVPGRQESRSIVLTP